MIERNIELIWYVLLSLAAAFAMFFWFFYLLGQAMNLVGRLFRRRAS